MLLRTFITGILSGGRRVCADVVVSQADLISARPSARRRPKVELKDPVRLKDFVVGDKLELSLKNYLALVMANNTDIQIQMLSLETPKNAIQRAFGIWDPLARASFTSNRTVTQSTSVLDGVRHHRLDRFACPAGPVFVCPDPAHGHQLHRDLFGGKDQHLQQ